MGKSGSRYIANTRVSLVCVEGVESVVTLPIHYLLASFSGYLMHSWFYPFSVLGGVEKLPYNNTMKLDQTNNMLCGR